MKIYFKVLLTNQNPIEKQNFLSAIHTQVHVTWSACFAAMFIHCYELVIIDY